jgi:hypothetical protein
MTEALLDLCAGLIIAITGGGLAMILIELLDYFDRCIKRRRELYKRGRYDR